MRAELIPVDGGAPLVITRDITVIGRREYCDIRLDDPSLSKRHCVIVKTDGLLMIRDLATTNGTRVKGQMIRWAALLPNDRIAIGKLKFRVFLGPDTPIEVATAPGAAQPSRRPPPIAGPAVPRPPEPVSVAAVVPDPVLPRVDLDDSRWFDRMGSGDLDDVIIDLE